MATIWVFDRTWTNIATLIANQLKSVIKTDSVYSNVIFRGEIRSMKIQYNKIQYIAYGKAQKLLNQRANYDPRIFIGYFRMLEYDAGTIRVQDDDAAFGAYANHLLHFQDIQKNSIIVPPNGANDYDIQEYTAGATDALKEMNGASYASANYSETGDMDNLYFDDGVGTYNSSNIHGFEANAAKFEIWGVIYEHYFAVKTGVSVSSLKFEARIKTRNLSRFSLVDTSFVDPFVGIKETDAQGETVDIIYFRAAQVGSRFSGNGQSYGNLTGISPWMIQNVTVSSSISNYLETVATSDDGEFTLYRVKTVIGGGAVGSLRKVIYSRQVKLTVTLDSDQAPNFGVCKISSNTATVLTIADMGTDGEEAIKEGVGQNDVYVITDTLDDQINTIAAAWGITITDNITNATVLALTDNYLEKTRLQLFQDITDLSNSIWYYDPVTDAYFITSIDNLSSTGITLTNADIVGWHDSAWSYDINSDKIRDTVRVVAAQHVAPQSVSTTPEFAHALGNEEIVIQKPDIQGEYMALKHANNQAKKYEKARRRATLTLDYDNPNQTYTAVAKGKTIALKLPDASDTSICNHSVGNLGELLIVSIQYDKDPAKGNRNFVTLTLESRDS